MCILIWAQPCLGLQGLGPMGHLANVLLYMGQAQRGVAKISLGTQVSMFMND